MSCIRYCCCFPVSIEIYSEEHIADLQGGYKADKRVQMGTPTAGSLYNPSIPVEPPKVLDELLSGQVPD